MAPVRTKEDGSSHDECGDRMYQRTNKLKTNLEAGWLAGPVIPVSPSKAVVLGHTRKNPKFLCIAYISGAVDEIMMTMIKYR